MASSYNIKQNKNKFQNKKTQSQINNLGKGLFLLGLNYDGGTTETVLNSKMITAMMKINTLTLQRVTMTLKLA